MRRDNELRVIHDKIVDPRKHGELPLGRKRGFRFIKQVKAFSAKAVQLQRHERLAVGLLVQGFSAVRVDNPRPGGGLSVKSLDFRGNVEETLRAEEEPVPRPRNTFREAQVPLQLRM